MREAVHTEASALAADMVRRLLAEREEKRAKDKDQAARRTGRLQVSLSGFLQADGVLYRQDSLDEVDPSTGEPLNETRFLIRRARLDGEVSYRFLGGAVRFEGNTIQGPTARIIGAEAWVRWPVGPSGSPGPSGPPDPPGKSPEHGRPPLVMVAIGLLKIPFGLEVPQYNADRLFLERSNVSRAFFPGDFDLGVRVHGGVRFLRYAIAAMNGDPVGARGYPGRDPNQSKDLLGRLGIDVSPGRRLSVAGGVSGLYGTGFHRGTPATKDVLTWRDANGDGLVQLSELQVISGVAATPSQNFRRFALGVDLRLTAAIPRLGTLTLSGEILWAANLDRGLLPADPVAVGRPLRELGGYVALTQELSPYAVIGVRYDRYNPDVDARQQAGADPVPLDSSFSTLAVAVAVRYPALGPPHHRVRPQHQCPRPDALGRGDHTRQRRAHPARAGGVLMRCACALRLGVGLDGARAWTLALAALALASASALALASGGCAVAPADRGLLALLRVEGAQFYPGRPPGARGGPDISGLLVGRTVVRPGEVGFGVSGAATAGTTAVVLSLERDAGYWVLAAGVPDVTAPDQPTYTAQLSFAPTLPSGPRNLAIQAVDAAGRAGPPRLQALTVAEGSSALPDGALVIGLRWDTEADLDLHVVEPGGAEIWARKPTGSTPDGGVSDAGTTTPGVLDVDSNALCVIDGRRAENVLYAQAPAAGTYLVRIDAWSLCGETYAHWVVEVRRNGEAVARTAGELVPSATRGPHGPGAGLLALTFTVP